MKEIIQTIYGVGGLALLYFGAEWLVKGGKAIASRCRISSLIVGLTLVAFGTSAPELFVSADAALQGMGNMATGNVIGSNICNIVLILGLSALIAPLNVSSLADNEDRAQDQPCRRMRAAARLRRLYGLAHPCVMNIPGRDTRKTQGEICP